VAIYHLSTKPISRGKGQNVVACAAYRSGEKLMDERCDKVHDYTKKQDVAHSEILTPDTAPAWMKEREQLWNHVEKIENRKDARLAREVQVSLPRELRLEQNKELLRDFVKHTFVDRGMVADMAIHMDKASDGQLQPHAHILLTTREVTDTGFGYKVPLWNSKKELMKWREAWSEHGNKHLALNGHDMQIDHRSYKDQGIDLVPQTKIGPVSKFNHMAAYEDHQRIARENGERLLEKPEIIFDVLIRQQSTFTHHDIARLVNRYTVDQEQFQAVYEKVKSSPQLVSLGTDDKNRERFTTRDTLTLESKMVDDARELASQSNHLVRSGVNQEKIINAHGLLNEQKEVLNYAVSGGDLVGVIGYAGTGKSRLLGAVKEVYEASGYRVVGATLSGIAAENLEVASGIESRTLASRFHYWGKGEELLSSRDVLIIDEAGMVGSRQMADVLAQVKTQGAKVILVGDPEQLQAIEAGAAFRAVIEHTSHVELTEIWRQKEEWQKQATIQFATQKTGEAIAQYAARDCVHEFATQDEAKRSIIDAWNDVRISSTDKSQIMLAYTRKDVLELNQMARSLRQSLGELNDGHAIQTERGERQLSSGDRIYFLKNDRDLGVKNGTLGTVLDINDKTLSVQVDKEGVNRPHTVAFSTERYNHLDYGYAATIHKAQGVTVDRTYVLASSYLDRHACYVAMSRHRDGAELFWSKDVFPEYDKMVEGLSRERAKDITLDYSHDAVKAEFARYRGMDGLWDSFSLSNELAVKDLTNAMRGVDRDRDNKAIDDFFKLTDADLKQLDQMEKRMNFGYEGLDEFKQSFYNDHPDLACQAVQSLDDYFSEKKSPIKTEQKHIDRIDKSADYPFDKEQPYKMEMDKIENKTEKTISREDKGIELEIEF
jgi:Ti-type conjugative transfer relaxase TraA